jgi:hypothetical protein
MFRAATSWREPTLFHICIQSAIGRARPLHDAQRNERDGHQNLMRKPRAFVTYACRL